MPKPLKSPSFNKDQTQVKRRFFKTLIRAGLIVPSFIGSSFYPAISFAAAMNSADKCSLKDDINHSIAQTPISIAKQAFVTDEKSGLSLPIRLLNWNVQKISNTGWQKDLMAYAQSTNMVLLQEATEHVAIERQLSHLNFHSLAPGYHDGDQQTGVYTAAQVSPLSSCYQQHHEPWLRTPKAMQVSWYPIEGVKDTLLVVNVHSVNFALGLKDYRRQLMAIVDMLQAHTGPVILSGDFNTWSSRRLTLLNRHVSEHGLSAIDFVDDQRTQIFGQTLDHVFTRGFTVQHSQTWVTSSSDHNPIYAELALTALDQ